MVYLTQLLELACVGEVAEVGLVIQQSVESEDLAEAAVALLVQT
jgi:hypothetical protein